MNLYRFSMHPFWLLGIFCLLHFPLQAKHLNEEADYVVVGVGTAGSLMTERLTADKKTSVIAIHSGKNFTDSFILKYAQNIPFSVGASFLGVPPSIDLSPLPPDTQEALIRLIQRVSDTSQKLYVTGNTTPQVAADDRVLSWVMAKPLGGASSINAGAYVRLTPELLADWEAIAGPNWSVGRLLQIYKEIEDYSGLTPNKIARGTKGSLKVTQNPPPSTLGSKFAFATIKATGFPFLEDFNDPDTPIGVSVQMQSAHRGDNGFYRVSGVNAFLNDHVMHGNGKGANGRRLVVHLNSLALRVVWEGNKAVGVEYLEDGVKKIAYARKGVVVAAGLGSSPFLLHSGVGPAPLLNALGIPVIFDNPNVGQGLIDQTPVTALFATNPDDSIGGTTTIFSGISNLPSPTGSPTGRQIRFAVIDVIPGLTPMIVDLLQPQSRGSITIVSPDPLVQPVIDFGLLSNPADLDLLTAAFQTYVKNLAAELQAVDQAYQLLLPPPEILDDAGLVADYIKAIASTDFHYQGHCRMAPLADGGVVDSFGRVYGVQNLIVADNSIVPHPIDGSPMTSAYLIAANVAKLMGY